MSAERETRRGTAILGAIRRINAIAAKELVQMRRDRLTFAMMLLVPVIQLLLFGYAINTDPKNLPTAAHLEERTPLVRSVLAALGTSDSFDIVVEVDDPAQSARLLASGEVAFVISFPAGFTADLMRGERPQLLVEADASDPVATSTAIARLDRILSAALVHDLRGPLAGLAPTPGPIDLVIHQAYNPEGVTQYNIVPGLLGVILTMTLVMITSMAMTRETERGTLENLLAMPARPFEVMVGKISPYIGVGVIQTLVVLVVARVLFGIPFAGSAFLMALGVTLFIVANLALGFTFSTIARSQMQAMQLTFFFFLPSILLSGFMFPFRGMPGWAQAIGEALPLTHFVRIVRGVMLKDAQFADLAAAFASILAFTLAIGVVAILRYRRTLD